MVGSASCLFVGVKGCLQGLGCCLPHQPHMLIYLSTYVYTRKLQYRNVFLCFSFSSPLFSKSLNLQISHSSNFFQYLPSTAKLETHSVLTPVTSVPQVKVPVQLHVEESKDAGLELNVCAFFAHVRLLLQGSRVSDCKNWITGLLVYFGNSSLFNTSFKNAYILILQIGNL